MKHLILDFLKRLWWLVLAFAIFTFISAATGSPIIFTVLGFFAVQFDRQRGLPLVLSTLPISRRTQAITGWFVSVLLLPLLAAVILPLGLWADVFSMASGKSAPPMSDLWFRAYASCWLALGYGALLSLLSLTFPTRPAVTAWQSVGAALAAMCWGVSAFGALWLLHLMPRTSADLQTRHWLLLGVVPVLVLLSFLAAPLAIKRRPQRTSIEPAPTQEAKAEKPNSRSLTGMSLLAVKMQTMSVGIYILGVALMGMTGLLSGRFHQALTTQTIDRFTPMFIVMISGMIPDSFNLRMLRIMPISTTKLTSLLLAAPIIIGLLSAGVATFVGFQGDPHLPLWVNRMSQAVAITALGSLMLAASLNFSTSLRFVTLILLIMTTSLSVESLPSHPLLCLTLGSAGILGSALWIFHGLKRSLKPYRLRQKYGPQFGQLSTPR